ncbi:MAG: hypothetical protein KDJ72_02310 [Methyloceanibacter sp.]|uniref:hypothetical protein n=1 Tax=Methyloceanibacter sp. TaxID=1965321 RepID=UPI001D1C32BD|nr:hypothetical protein [Methyloceanibacter sp.]MCB1441830.1 hypothetical protein [Methyloceanibacter sp.]MCC0058580.1 hypothetical protein [Hyphomicrobiaceae bacterium]
MADKQRFTPEEWAKILMSPTVASMAITAADPSGLWGMLKESFASGAALVAAKTDPETNPLIKALIADYETADGRGELKEALRARFAGAKPDELVGRTLAELGEVAQILDAKAPEDAAAFKAWLADISQKVAEASTEGGFLGFGGVQVSDAEKATLADVQKTLGTIA